MHAQVLYSFLLAGFLAPQIDICHASYWPLYVTPFLFYGVFMLAFARRSAAGRQLEPALA